MQTPSTQQHAPRWIALWGLIVAVLLAACGGATPPSAPADDAPTAPTATAVPLSGEAVIYVVAPLSGPNAEQGQAEAAGARLAADILNEQGGLLGQRIVVETLNDRGTPEGALEAAETIAASSENIAGIVVSETSDPELTSARQVYLGNNGPDTLVVVPASTSPLAEDLTDNRFFRLSAPNRAQAAEIAAVMRGSNFSDVMVISDSSAEGTLLAESFRQSAEELGVPVSNSVALDADTTDFQRAAAEIFDANPAALFVSAAPFETGQILSALYAIDYQGAIYAADLALPYAVVDELGCQAEGLYRASVLPGPNTVMAADQLQRYAANEGRVAEPFSVAGYAAVQFIANAYAGVGEQDADAAAKYARSDTVPTLIGDLQFDAQGNRVDSQMHFQQVQGRLFRDAFARVVGAPVTITDEDGATDETLLELTFDTSAEPIIFADLNWNSALFHNAVARFILEAGYGQPTYAVPGSTVPSFQRLVRGEVDVVIERYNFDDTVAEALDSGQIADMGVLFPDAVQGWFVPRYMIEGDAERGIDPITPDLQTVDQLDQYAGIFSQTADGGATGQLFGGVPGWTAYKINCLKLKAYRLDDDFALTTSSSTADLFGALDTAYSSGAPVLVYLWSPTWPIARYDLVQIEEPAYDPACWETTRGCAYPSSDVRVLVSGSLPDRAPDAAALLEAMDISIEAVGEVLLQIEDEGLSPDEAALIWLRDNAETWSAWVTDDVAERVQDALNTAS